MQDMEGKWRCLQTKWKGSRMKCSGGCLEMAFRYKQRSVCGRRCNESSLRRQRKNKEQAAVRRAVDRGLEMLQSSKSIQIKWLFRIERSISLTLDFNHLSLLRHFNDIVGDSGTTESLNDRFAGNLTKHRNANPSCFVFSLLHHSWTLETFFRPTSILSLDRKDKPTGYSVLVKEGNTCILQGSWKQIDAGG